MDLSEVVVVSDSENKRSNCSIYNFKGHSLASFKEGNSVKHGLAFIGQDYVISALKQQPKLKIWTLSEMFSEGSTMQMPGLVSCLAITASGSYCIAGIENTIHVWEVASGSHVGSIQYHSKTVTCIRISSDGSHFVSGGGDGLVLAWVLTEVIGENDETPDQLRPRFTLMDHCAEVTDIHIGGIGIYSRIATASRDMTCRLYELETGLLLVTVHVDYGITAVIMDELDSYLMLGSAEGDIYRINLFSNEESELHYDKASAKHVFRGHTKEVTCLSLSLCGKKLVSGSEDSQCKIWDVDSLSCIKTINSSGPITNAFVTLLPTGLRGEKARYCPKLNVATFQRNFSKIEELFSLTRIHPKELSLFHVGVPDEHFDSRLLINAAESTASLNHSVVAVKDVASINSQIYSYALCDTIYEMSMNCESSGGDDEGEFN